MQFPFFKKKYSLLDLRVFEGMTDWHSHILPGVDDGIASMQDALDALAYYEQIGVSEAWLTPHVLEDIPNTPEQLRQCFCELQKAYKGGVRIHLAAENMVDDLFAQRLGADDVLSLGTDGRHLLIEFSYIYAPVGLMATLGRIKEKGLCPVIAHPERYAFMSHEDYVGLKKMGCKLQLNVLSLTGAYGRTAQQKAQTLLEQDMYDVCGTDLHSLRTFQSHIAQKVIRKDIAEKISICSHKLL